jgi:hypothetical protein
LEKSIYYVSVQAGTVLQNQGEAAYEFEIEATAKEADKLLELLEMKQETEEDTFLRAHVPNVPYHFDQENDVHDEHLKGVYRFIYGVGTPETKQFLEENQII